MFLILCSIRPGKMGRFVAAKFKIPIPLGLWFWTTCCFVNAPKLSFELQHRIKLHRAGTKIPLHAWFKICFCWVMLSLNLTWLDWFTDLHVGFVPGCFTPYPGPGTRVPSHLWWAQVGMQNAKNVKTERVVPLAAVCIQCGSRPEGEKKNRVDV